jgi:hypothetical protein
MQWYALFAVRKLHVCTYDLAADFCRQPDTPDCVRWRFTICDDLNQAKYGVFSQSVSSGAYLIHSGTGSILTLRALQAPLIACFASAIRRILQYSRPSESDLLFWRERLLVIAPHHIQRQQIRTQLLNKTFANFLCCVNHVIKLIPYTVATLGPFPGIPMSGLLLQSRQLKKRRVGSLTPSLWTIAFLILQELLKKLSSCIRVTVST